MLFAMQERFELKHYVIHGVLFSCSSQMWLSFPQILELGIFSKDVNNFQVFSIAALKFVIYSVLYGCLASLLENLSKQKVYNDWLLPCLKRSLMTAEAVQKEYYKEVGIGFPLQ